MPGKKDGIKSASVRADMDLSRTLIKIIAIGFAGGAALVGGAKAFGDHIDERQKHSEGDKR